MRLKELTKASKNVTPAVRRGQPKRKSRKGNNQTGQPPSSNVWDVCIRLIDAMYDLAQTGNLPGLIVFSAIVWGFYATYKFPPESVGGFFGAIAEFLDNEKYYLFPLLSALIVSVVTNVIQGRVYRRHIKDLTDHRKVLVHGRETGELKPLEIHTSSGFDIENDSANR